MSWIFYAIGSAFFAALVAIFGKVGLTHVDSTLATTIRSLFMAGFLVLISFVFGKFAFTGSIDSKALTFIVLSGVAGALSWLCYFLALRYGPTTAVAAIDRTSVVIVLVLAVLFLGEPLRWQSALGALFVVGGAILISTVH